MSKYNKNIHKIYGFCVQKLYTLFCKKNQVNVAKNNEFDDVNIDIGALI